MSVFCVCLCLYGWMWACRFHVTLVLFTIVHLFSIIIVIVSKSRFGATVRLRVGFISFGFGSFLSEMRKRGEFLICHVVT